VSAEVSPMRSTVINSASSTRESFGRPETCLCTLTLFVFLLVQEQQDSYEESRRKIARGAKAYVEAAIEGQRVSYL